MMYAVVGVGGTIAYLMLLAFQVELLTMDPVIASIISYIPVIFGSYYLSHAWVFRSDQSHRTAFIRYLAVTGLGFIINTFCIYFTVHIYDWWYLYGQIVAFFLVASTNFLLNHFWTFRRVPRA